METQLKFKVLFSLCVALLLSYGCNTYQKRLNRSTDFFRANTGELAKLCATEFVPETLRVSKTDTLITTDTVYAKQDSVPCPPALPGKTVFVKCPPAQTIIKTVKLRDTVTITSPAKERVLTDSLIIYKERVRKSEESNKSKTKTIWILGAFIGATILAAFLKITGRI